LKSRIWNPFSIYKIESGQEEWRGFGGSGEYVVFPEGRGGGNESPGGIPFDVCGSKGITLVNSHDIGVQFLVEILVLAIVVTVVNLKIILRNPTSQIGKCNKPTLRRPENRIQLLLVNRS
jgi:hypothetical protein